MLDVLYVRASLVCCISACACRYVGTVHYVATKVGIHLAVHSTIYVRKCEMTQGSVDTSIAGLQMSYLYQQAGRDYIVFERNDVAGWLYVRRNDH